MSQDRYNNVKKIMETPKGVPYLKTTDKCKLQHLQQFVQLHNLKLKLNDIIGYYDYALLGGGKKGMLLTCDYIYSSLEGKITKPLYFDAIITTQAVDKNLIVTWKNKEEETIFLPVYNAYISDLINRVIALSAPKTVEKPKVVTTTNTERKLSHHEQQEIERKEKLQKERKAEIRRQHEERIMNEQKERERQLEQKREEQQRLAQQQREKDKAAFYASLSAEDKVLHEKALARKQLVESEVVEKPTPPSTGVDGHAIVKEYMANPKPSEYFCNALEVAIYNLSNVVALIDKESFTMKNKIDIQRHFKDVNINDVVYFYDGYTVHKEKEWAVVTAKELIVTTGLRLPLTGISSCQMSRDESYLHINYADRQESVHYKTFSTLVVQIIVQGTINAYNQLWNRAWNLEQEKNYKEAFHYHLEAALNGSNAAAFNSIGIYLYNGWYVKQDKEYSFEWYEKAAALGNTYAMSNLALNYKNKKEYANAWRHLNKALSMTDVKNRDVLLNTAGLMLRDGLGIDKDRNKALQYFRESSNLGNMYASYNLADNALYYDYDYKKALEYILTSIKQKHKAGYKLLADCYQYGKHVLKNEETALYWYEKAKSEKYNAARFGIATQYLNEYKYDEAILEYLEAAENGNNYAFYSLAKVYLNPKYHHHNVDEALYYLEKGAQRNNSNCIIKLAEMYMEGNGVVKDYFMAFDLLNQAKEKGYINANGLLAVLYLNGWGINKNTRKAMDLFEEGMNENDTRTTYEYAKVCLTNKDFNIKEGINHLFALTEKKGHVVYHDVQKTLIDYLSKHPYKLTREQTLSLFTNFNELYEIDPSVLDKKASIERLTKTTIPLYSNMDTIDWDVSTKDKLVSLLEVVANNPRNFLACNDLAKVYFSLLMYNESFYYHKLALSATDYIPDSETWFEYFYLCVELNHEYDKGKYLLQLVNTIYPNGKELFVKLVHKHRESVKKYEYSLSAVTFAKADPVLANKYLEDLHDIITRHHKKFDISNWNILYTAYNKALELLKNTDPKYIEIKDEYEKYYTEIYEKAKEGSVDAIQVYMVYGRLLKDYSKERVANLYSLMNESVTKKGHEKLIDFYTSSYSFGNIVQTLCNAKFFYRDFTSPHMHYMTNAVLDAPIYTAFAQAYANSKDIDELELFTKITKKVSTTELDVVEYSEKEMKRILESKPLIHNIQTLYELCQNRRYDLAYENVSELAKDNNPKAQTLLGKMYALGKGVDQNLEQAKKWFEKAHEANDLEGTLHLANVNYQFATTPDEFVDVYTLYTKAYEFADDQACYNALQILDITSGNKEDIIFWKYLFYRQGNAQAGVDVVNEFLKDPDIANYYFEDFTDRAKLQDPLALRCLAAAYQLGTLDIIDEEMSHEYEVKLIEALTNRNDVTFTSYNEMFNYVKDKDTRQMVLDYLYSINVCSTKKYFVSNIGDMNFITRCHMLQKHTNTETWLLVDNKYYSVRTLFHAVTQSHWRLFDTNAEVSFVSIGEQHFEFFHALERISGLTLESITEETSNTEDYSKEVDECWALHDNGEYKKAYEKVLPLAKQGIPKAINMLGLLFCNGLGVEQDLHKAQQWFQVGINKEYDPCYTNMGNLYYLYSKNETEGKKAAYYYYRKIMTTANKTICKRALEILLSGIVPYDQLEENLWKVRLLQLGETEYLDSLGKEN